MAVQIATPHAAPGVMPAGIATMSQRRRHEPAYVVCGDDSMQFYAAKWHLPAHRIRTDCRMDNILVGRRRGAAPITKTVGAKSQRSYAMPGAFTFIPSGEYAHYDVEGASVFLELYVSPHLLQRFADEHELPAGVALRPVLAQPDPWLAGYFQMLECEIEQCSVAQRAPGSLDLLMLGQAQQLLLAHLVRGYSGLAASKLGEFERSANGALRPQLLRRVLEYIDCHIAHDIRLADLANLAHLSERHFIRAFRAATGCTPYRYVLDQRLQACAQLLRSQPERSIADIARGLCFRSRPHFTAKFTERFGVTPSAFRIQET